MKFTRTSAHAPEPGLGGAMYEAHTVPGGEYVGLVSSTSDTHGVYWIAERPDGTTVMDGDVPYAFETRKQAGQRLFYEAAP